MRLHNVMHTFTEERDNPCTAEVFKLPLLHELNFRCPFRHDSLKKSYFVQNNWKWMCCYGTLSIGEIMRVFLWKFHCKYFEEAKIGPTNFQLILFRRLSPPWRGVYVCVLKKQVMLHRIKFRLTFEVSFTSAEFISPHSDILFFRYCVGSQISLENINCLLFTINLLNTVATLRYSRLLKWSFHSWMES